MTDQFLPPHCHSAPLDSCVGSVSLSMTSCVTEQCCIFLRSCNQPGSKAPHLIFFPPTLPHRPLALTFDAVRSLSPQTSNMEAFPQALLRKKLGLRHISASCFMLKHIVHGLELCSIKMMYKRLKY